MTRRADRLFRIIEILRRCRSTTAAAIAEELEVSVRTVYRDIRDLMASGVPIRGEAGFGYALEPGFDLPPISLTQEEAEALALGAKIVAAWSDRDLGRVAEGALAKIIAKLPKAQADAAQADIYVAPGQVRREKPSISLIELRHSIASRQKIRIKYESGDGAESERTVWPLALAFFGPVWLLLAWCESRSDFRNFRLDRIRNHAAAGETYPHMRGRRLQDYLTQTNRSSAS
jgi:predicted DNA-binding transcriptional regulator YafY